MAPQFVIGYAMIVAVMLAGLLMHFAPSRWTVSATRAFAATPLIAQSLLLAAVLFLIIQARSADLVPFIYLQY